ncbi:MAG: RNA-binding protein [Bacillota bacterium]
MSVSLGQVVVSRAGRDAGRRFVVVKVVDDLYVEISDGDLRKIEKPKRKKVKHLNITDEKAENLEEKLKSGAKITNAEIRKALADLDF